MNSVYTINLICLETNECLRSFTSRAIGIVEKKEAEWYQTKKNIKVVWLE